MKVFDAFERIVVINLPERTDRRREMVAELRKANIDAIDPRLQFYPAIRPSVPGLFPSLGARGCFESHLGVIRAAIRDRLHSVLILEDDLALTPAACVEQRRMFERVAGDGWDFAYPGHFLPTPDAPSAPAWAQTDSPLVCAHFYGLHWRILPDLCRYLEACTRRPPGHPDGGPMHVDGAYSMFRARHPDVVTLISTPSLGGQRSSRSDITHNRWYDRQPMTRLLAGLARKGKNVLRTVGQSTLTSRS